MGSIQLAHSPHIEYLLALVRAAVTSSLTANTYEQAIKRFLLWWQERPHLSSPAAAIDCWKQELRQQGLSPSSVNVYLSAVRKLFSIMAREGMISADVLETLRQVSNFPVHGTRIGRWLNENEMRLLLMQPDRSTAQGIRDYALLALALACGLRASELIALVWEHIQYVDNLWLIMNLRGKHGRVRTIPIADFAVEALEEYRRLLGDPEPSSPIFRSLRAGRLGDDPITRQTVYAIVTQYSRQIGRPVSPHDLRRSAAKFLSGHIGILQTREYLGHSSVRVTERYLGTAIDLNGIQETMSSLISSGNHESGEGNGQKDGHKSLLHGNCLATSGIPCVLNP